MCNYCYVKLEKEGRTQFFAAGLLYTMAKSKGSVTEVVLAHYWIHAATPAVGSNDLTPYWIRAATPAVASNDLTPYWIRAATPAVASNDLTPYWIHAATPAVGSNDLTPYCARQTLLLAVPYHFCRLIALSYNPCKFGCLEN